MTIQALDPLVVTTAFGADVAGYAAGRLDYPDALFAHLADRCGLTLGAAVLEIGPGTGQATRRMLDMGASVVAVEPDPALAAHLRGAGTDLTLFEAGSRLAAATGAIVGEVDTIDLPLASFDLIVWPGGLEAVNDVPGALARLRALLAPDGLLLGAFVGDGSLARQRRAVMSEGVRPIARLHPQIDLSATGNLLQRTGFALPVVDVDALTVRYRDWFALVRDLRACGLSSRLASAPPSLTRDEAARIASAFAAQADPDGRIAEIFRVIHFSGWAPHPDQPQPARRGSATTSLTDALKPKA